MTSAVPIWIFDEKRDSKRGTESRYVLHELAEVSLGALAALLRTHYLSTKAAVVELLEQSTFEGGRHRAATRMSGVASMQGLEASARSGGRHWTSTHAGFLGVRLEALHCTEIICGTTATFGCLLGVPAANERNMCELLFAAEDAPTRERWLEALLPLTGDGQPAVDVRGPSQQLRELFMLCRVEDPDLPRVRKLLAPLAAEAGSGQPPPAGVTGCVEGINLKFGELRRTALHRAALRGSEALVRLLLEHGAATEMRDAMDKTPLHEAVLSGNLAVVQTLLAHGANPNAQKKKGSTPLHRAISNNQRHIAEALVRAGAAAHSSKGKRLGDLRVYKGTAFKAAISTMPAVAKLVLDRQFVRTTHQRWAQVGAIWREQRAALLFMLEGYKLKGAPPWAGREAASLMQDTLVRSVAKIFDDELSGPSLAMTRSHGSLGSLRHLIASPAHSSSELPPRHPGVQTTFRAAKCLTPRSSHWRKMQHVATTVVANPLAAIEHQLLDSATDLLHHGQPHASAALPRAQLAGVGEGAPAAAAAVPPLKQQYSAGFCTEVVVTVNPAPLRCCVLGSPASGKGTQCYMLLQHYARLGVVHLSTGDMLRAAVAAGTAIGLEAQNYMDRGALVPDEVIIGVVVERLAQSDCVEHGWLLDGFPRTPSQLEALVAVAGQQGGSDLMPNTVLVLDVSEKLVLERITGRRIGPDGRAWHLTMNPPPPSLRPEQLTQRSDDTAVKVRGRLASFRMHIDRIVAVAGKSRTRVVSVKADAGPEDVFAAVLSALALDELQKEARAAIEHAMGGGGSSSTPQDEPQRRKQALLRRAAQAVQAALDKAIATSSAAAREEGRPDPLAHIHTKSGITVREGHARLFGHSAFSEDSEEHQMPILRPVKPPARQSLKQQRRLRMASRLLVLLGCPWLWPLVPMQLLAVWRGNAGDEAEGGSVEYPAVYDKKLAMSWESQLTTFQKGRVYRVQCEGIDDEVLQLMCRLGRSELLQHPAVATILSLKWELFGRRCFWAELWTHLLFLLLFTVASVSRASYPASAGGWEAFVGSAAGADAMRALGAGQVWLLVAELALAAQTVHMARVELRQAREGGMDTFLDKWNMLDQMALWLIFAAVATRAAGAEQLAVSCVGLAAPLIWIKLLFFARGFKAVGEMTVLVTEMARDIVKLVWLLLIFLAAFSHALFVIDQRSSEEFSTLPRSTLTMM
jgi:adenylate kinase